jgi:hypothetical protein
MFALRDKGDFVMRQATDWQKSSHIQYEMKQNKGIFQKRVLKFRLRGWFYNELWGYFIGLGIENPDVEGVWETDGIPRTHSLKTGVKSYTSVLDHDYKLDHEKEQFVVNFPNEEKQDRIYLMQHDSSNMGHDLIRFDAEILSLKTSYSKPRWEKNTGWGVKDPKTNLYYEHDGTTWGYQHLCANEEEYMNTLKTGVDQHICHREYKCIRLRVYPRFDSTGPWRNRELFYDTDTEKFHVVVYNKEHGEIDFFKNRYKEIGLFTDCMEPFATQVKFVMFLVRPITKFFRPLTIFWKPFKWTLKILNKIEPHLQIGA